jgi:hypothetical protein
MIYNENYNVESKEKKAVIIKLLCSKYLLKMKIYF